MSKKKALNKALDMLLGPGEDTVDVTAQVQEQRDIDAELRALEQVVAQDIETESDEERRVRAFGTFKLQPLAKKLLAAACENVGSNMGSNTMEANAQKQIQERAALMASCDNQLPDAVDAIIEALGKDNPREASSVIYSTCFAVQKAANFIANLWYRRALDPVGDQDISDPNGKVGTVTREDGATFSADQREERRAPPYGLGPDHDETAYDAEGNRIVANQGEAQRSDETILEAYVELHDYLQLMVEVYGWDPERPMPYCYVTENNGATFIPITDPSAALDITEVKTQQSRRKRAVRQTQALAAALAARRKLLKAAAR